MRKKEYSRIVILLLGIVLLSSSASGICLIKGFVLNQDGTAADSNIPVKIRLAGSEEVHTVLTGGPVSNFYLQSIYQCRTGEDVAVIEVEYGDYKVGVHSLLESPYQDINITLALLEDYEPEVFDETQFIEEEITIGRLVQVKDGKEVMISPLDTVLYEFKGFDQRFELKHIKYPFIAGVFPNLGSTIAQAVGAVDCHDLDLNGAVDTEIYLIDIEANQAKLIFKSITEVFPEAVKSEEEVGKIMVPFEEEKPSTIFIPPEKRLQYINSFLIFVALVLIGWLLVNITTLVNEKLTKARRRK